MVHNCIVECMEVCFPREKIHEDRVSLHAGIESAEEGGHDLTSGKVKRIKNVCIQRNASNY